MQGKYKILKQIDSGGQSDIYLAERNDGVYKQTVVIKFISGQFQQCALKQQFLQEMQLLADLHHPGVVTIIDGNLTEDGQPWLVLEYIDGKHIDQYCHDEKLNSKDIIKLIVNLCDSLDFIHQRGIFHKDIKPSNVLVKSINGVPYPVLIDFGIAQDIHSEGHSELVFATYGYSAPEQIDNKNPDLRTDIYSLGMVLLKLLMGPEFEASNKNLEIRQVLKRSSLSSDLKLILGKCLHKNPAKRYDSSLALRSDLNNLLMGYPLSFNSHRLSHVFIKTLMRNRLVSVLVFSVLILGGYFAIKYANDIQYQKSLAVKEKNATNELMNFMLHDLNEGLTQIGKVDLLQSVVNQSLDHMESQNWKELDNQSLLQTAKAYVNSGRVLDQLEQSEKAKDAYAKATQAIQLMSEDLSLEVPKLQLLMELNVYKSQVLSTQGQEQQTEITLKQAIAASESLMQLSESPDLQYYWEAQLELAYHYLEYAKDSIAKKHIDAALQICRDQLSINRQSSLWVHNLSHSFQLLAWYEFDFGELSRGIDALKQAIQQGELAIQYDKVDLRKQNNLRILNNQLSFFHLENEELEKAKNDIEKALQLGLNLKLKAPLNKEFNRELAYSYSTATEILFILGLDQEAMKNIEKGLEISRENYLSDPENYSLANDFAIDLILSSRLKSSADEKEAGFQKANEVISPASISEPNNNYYKHTLLVTLLYLDRFAEAKPLFEHLQKEGLVDAQLKQIIEEKGLGLWLNEIQ